MDAALIHQLLPSEKFHLVYDSENINVVMLHNLIKKRKLGLLVERHA